MMDDGQPDWNKDPEPGEEAGARLLRDPGQGGPAPAQQGDLGVCACFSVKYYAPLFDVDTSDVMARMGMALLPTKATAFLETTQANPDAYGPIWISTTLLFTIAVVANLLSWAESENQAEWKYDFEMVVTCSAIIYGWTAAVPTALWFTLRYLLVNIRLITVACVYGYSLTPFIVAVALCLVPFNWISWVLLMATGAASSFFLLRAFGGLVVGQLPDKAVFILAGLGCAQLALAVTIKLMFFGGV